MSKEENQESMNQKSHKDQFSSSRNETGWFACGTVASGIMTVVHVLDPITAHGNYSLFLLGTAATAALARATVIAGLNAIHEAMRECTNRPSGAERPPLPQTKPPSPTLGNGG